MGREDFDLFYGALVVLVVLAEIYGDIPKAKEVIETEEGMKIFNFFNIIGT